MSGASGEVGTRVGRSAWKLFDSGSRLWAWTASLARRKVLSDAMALTSAQLLASILGFAFWMVANRLYSFSVIGLDAVTINTALLVSLFASLGLDSFLALHLGRDPRAARLVRGGLLLSAVASFALAALLLPAAHGLDAMRVPLGALLATALTLSLVLDGALVGLGESRRVLARAAFVGTFRIGALVALAWTGARFAILGAWALSGLVVALFTLDILRRVPKAASEAGSGAMEAAAVARENLPNSVASVILPMPGLLFPILLTWHGMLELAGIFYFIWMIVSFFHMVPRAMGRAILGHSAADRNDRRTALYASTAASVVAVGLFALVGRPLLRLYGGPELAAHFVPAAFLTLSAVLSCGTQFHMSRLRQEGRWRELATVAAMASALALGAGWLLIPPFALWGVVVAWLGSQAVLLLALKIVRLRPTSTGDVHASTP